MKQSEVNQGHLEGFAEFQPSPPLSALGPWKVIAILVLSLWIGGSLVLDLVVMPSLYWAGMMADPGFMDAGAVLFGTFNRVELLLAGTTLAGLLAASYLQEFSPRLQHWTVVLGGVLLAVVLVDTYGLTPHMVSLGATLNWPTLASTVPEGMNQLHGAYFALEMVKLLTGALVLGLCVRDRRSPFSTVR
ncbi:MAG: DUF4149 domain-containing protein [Cyanobacteria bacterium P01_C01_bin.89]